MEHGAATPETVTRQARIMDTHRRCRRAKITCKRGPSEPEDGVVRTLPGHHDPQELSCDRVVDQHKLRHIFPLGPLAVQEAQDRFVRLLVMDHVLFLEREDLPPRCATSVDRVLVGLVVVPEVVHEFAEQKVRLLSRVGLGTMEKRAKDKELLNCLVVPALCIPLDPNKLYVCSPDGGKSPAPNHGREVARPWIQSRERHRKSWWRAGWRQ